MPTWCGFFAFIGDFENIFDIKSCCIPLDTLVSGTPIIQNGKLIGAVTHVFINDSKKGYAIFAENMLETAQSAAKQQLKEVS